MMIFLATLLLSFLHAVLASEASGVQCIKCKEGNVTQLSPSLAADFRLDELPTTHYCTDFPDNSHLAACSNPRDVCVAYTVLATANDTVTLRGCADEVLSVPASYKLRPMLTSGQPLCYAGGITPNLDDYTAWPNVAGCVCLGTGCNTDNPGFDFEGAKVSCSACEVVVYNGKVVTSTCSKDNAAQCKGTYCGLTHEKEVIRTIPRPEWTYTSEIYQAYCLNSSVLPNCTYTSFNVTSPDGAYLKNEQGSIAVRFCQGEDCEDPWHKPPTVLPCHPLPSTTTPTTTPGKPTIPPPNQRCYTCTDHPVNEIPDSVKGIFNIPSSEFADSRCGNAEPIFPEEMNTAPCAGACVTFKLFNAYESGELTLRGCSNDILKTGSMPYVADIVEGKSAKDHKFCAYETTSLFGSQTKLQDGAFCACRGSKCNNFVPSKAASSKFDTYNCPKTHCSGTHCAVFDHGISEPQSVHCVNASLSGNFCKRYGKFAHKSTVKLCQTHKKGIATGWCVLDRLC